MFVRVVRFTDVSAERMESMLTRISEAGGPPEGITTTGLKVLFVGRRSCSRSSPPSRT
jgi:hypothetical protein